MHFRMELFDVLAQHLPPDTMCQLNEMFDRYEEDVWTHVRGEQDKLSIARCNELRNSGLREAIAILQAYNMATTSVIANQIRDKLNDKRTPCPKCDTDENLEYMSVRPQQIMFTCKECGTAVIQD